ncbi:MAG: restriction endonuclease [Proteobacteria bacterium]|nr:restriction endonuclease [Pseudomonadota bacterium]
MLMAKRSLFAVLSRSPWWLSVLLAAGVFMLVRQFMPDYAAFASTLPFLGIAGYAGWRQSRVPDPERVAEALTALRAMSWQDFSEKMETAFRSDGYAVAVLKRGAADFELKKGGRVALACCKRWKVAQTGIEPLRELLLAKEAAEAQDCIYVAAGDLSQNARQFAAEKKIQLLGESELVQLLARSGAGAGKFADAPRR